MQSAKTNTDAPWKMRPLFTGNLSLPHCRGGISKCGEPLDAALQNQTTMKPNRFKQILSALLANDLGDPAALNELVQEGHVFGSIGEMVRRGHEIMLRDAGFPGKRECVTNSGEDSGREDCVVNADVSLDEMEGSWMKISPYGVFPGSVPGRDQYFGQDEANAVVANFHSVFGKLGWVGSQVINHNAWWLT